MTPTRLKELMAMTGDDRNTISRLLGYAANNSIRQCESGKQSLPEHKARWLEDYAWFRARQRSELDQWFKENPPPRDKKS